MKFTAMKMLDIVCRFTSISVVVNSTVSIVMTSGICYVYWCRPEVLGCTTY